MRNTISFTKINPKTSYSSISEFTIGFRKGIPIALGYIPVSFTFGLMAVSGGIPPTLALLISMTNLTSAGQFAGTSLMIQQATLVEIAFTTFIINIRYMLMSLALSQKISSTMPMIKRCIMAFGITDETFTVASLENREVSFGYMMGLICCPYLGWALGTALGALSCSMLPISIQNSMGIALYGMFMALIIPAWKQSKAALLVTLSAISISCLFTYIPLLTIISSGWKIILSTVLASTLGAILFPKEEESYE